MGAGHGPRPQPVGGSAVLVRGQLRMFPAYFAATPGATTDPDPVLGHSGPGQGWQLGDVDQIHSFFRQFATAAWAALLRDRHSYWRSGDIFGPRRLAKGEGAFTRLAAGAPGLPGTGPFGERGGLALGAPLELVIFSHQSLVAGRQLSHLLLQHRDPALQLRHQG